MSQWWSRIITTTQWYSGYHRSYSRTAGGSFNSVSSCWAVLCLIQTSRPKLALSPSPRKHPLTIIINLLFQVWGAMPLSWLWPQVKTGEYWASTPLPKPACTPAKPLASAPPTTLQIDSISNPQICLFLSSSLVLCFFFFALSLIIMQLQKKGCIWVLGTLIPWMEVAELNFSNLIEIELADHGKINHHDVRKKSSILESKIIIMVRAMTVYVKQCSKCFTWIICLLISLYSCNITILMFWKKEEEGEQKKKNSKNNREAM